LYKLRFAREMNLGVILRGHFMVSLPEDV
jgi:hypothetical protein